jgi:hypothetical protein
MEMEGGFDAEILDGRIRMDLTYYRKTRKDAFIDHPLATSLPDIENRRRFGEIRYTGTELGLDAEILENRWISWQGGMTLSRNTSQLLSIRRGEEFPVQVGPWLTVDSFPPGAKNPNYQMVLNSGMTFFNGRLGVFTSFTYMGGLLQRNLTSTPIFTDTTSIKDLEYGAPEAVNAFRWQTLSINYDAPMAFARLLRVGAVGIALQGANLGLWSNYSGIDPNVSALVTGNATFDAGQVPQPRSWQLKVTLRR